MDSTVNNTANSLKLPEIPVIQISVISNEGKQVEFSNRPSGLIALSKTDFESLVSSRQEFSDQLMEAHKTINDLRDKLSETEATTNTNGVPDVATHYKMLTELLQEKQKLAEQLPRYKEEALHFKSEATKQKKLVDSYEIDYNSLLADYNYLEKLYHRTRDLFRHKVSEVFKMQSELREIRIRPRAPEGCLNCGSPGHSFKCCKKAYSERFCQICANPDFSTDECPWPHVADGKFDVPEHQRCKVCKRPKNLPDVNCGECRRRVIEIKIAKRDQQIIELVKRTIEKPTLQNKRTSQKETCKVDDEASKPRSPVTRKTSPELIPSEIAGNDSRDPSRILAPFDSDDNNADLWETLCQAYKLGIKDEEE
ncbi:uncharacterized protein LOC127286075 [Leptopilina boulardi]|uniref:uncharacterized protein LOC127280278 n=1 Tax=Leptopilina boulardi TaxID=63433 RepID=UPI0021F5D821|nr:uncharacterized protein LOC127280278 [Leptopilina boulardi]XP_051168323.1 uncharacterized protein LOC127286075 [Leptopilina boulardi]